MQGPLYVWALLCVGSVCLASLVCAGPHVPVESPVHAGWVCAEYPVCAGTLHMWEWVCLWGPMWWDSGDGGCSGRGLVCVWGPQVWAGPLCAWLPYACGHRCVCGRWGDLCPRGPCARGVPGAHVCERGPLCGVGWGCPGVVGVPCAGGGPARASAPPRQPHLPHLPPISPARPEAPPLASGRPVS